MPALTSCLVLTLQVNWIGFSLRKDFPPLTYSHPWSFLPRALLYVGPSFVRTLYIYRYSSVQAIHHRTEVDVVVWRYRVRLSWILSGCSMTTKIRQWTAVGPRTHSRLSRQPHTCFQCRARCQGNYLYRIHGQRLSGISAELRASSCCFSLYILILPNI